MGVAMVEAAAVADFTAVAVAGADFMAVAGVDFMAVGEAAFTEEAALHTTPAAVPMGRTDVRADTLRAVCRAMEAGQAEWAQAAPEWALRPTADQAARERTPV
jgi:hypothetical protein